MKGKKDDGVWEEFEKTKDDQEKYFIAKCKHCGVEFRGNPSADRLRKHLLQLERFGIRRCTQVPEHVKNALANASTSSKRPRIESSSAINNNEFNNQGGSEQQWQEAPQHIEECFEGSDTSAHHRRKDACRTGPYPSSNEEFQPSDPDVFEGLEEIEKMINLMMQPDMNSEPPDQSFNEVNNLPSTSALQQHNEFQKGVQDGERMRANQECSVVPEPNGIRSCAQVVDHVKNALPDASTSSKRPRIESFSAINNDEFNNQGGSEQRWQEAPQHIEECFEGSDTSAHYRQKDACRTGPYPSSNEEFQPSDPDHEMINEMMQANMNSEPPDPSFNEVNNLPSTSALQQHNEFQKGVQDGERMRANQECSITPEPNGIRSCTQVLDHVKNALPDASTSSKRPWIEPPSSIDNNDFDNQGQGDNEQQMHEDFQCIQDYHEGSYTSAQNRRDNTSELRDMMAEMSVKRDNNSASTSAPQQNYDSQNQMQAYQPVVQGTGQECSVMPESSGDGEPFPTKNLVGEASQKNMDIVLKWLMDDQVSSIGIYGMGGVGKTTLLTHIYNRILENKSRFGDVYWVTVSQDFGIKMLQNRIAKSIDLKFGKVKDLKNRAAKLSKELRRKCKFVLILDDLWNHFDVNEIGMPTKVKGCKLIVTTRSLEVCREMNCQEKLKVEPLSKNDAWKLFLDTLEHDLAPEVKHIARSIVEECAGLPLGIVTVAASMREEGDIHVWENALTELRNSEVWKDNMEDEVFNILKFSYDRLNKHPRVQKCLLYCALYPEDFQVEKNELIKHLIVERIIERKDSRKEEFDKGHTILNQLENCCLLECIRHNDGDRVKMHDLVRDMAIRIMRECSPSLVKAGKGLTCLPEKRWWTKDIVRVSLMENDIAEIPPLFSIRCPNLSTLFLCHNNNLKSIAESFFYNLHGLKVLNLSLTNIEELPNSVANLKNLTALILTCCEYLWSLPSLRKLKALEMLDLFCCINFQKVPKGLESLENLNYLNLLCTAIEDLPAKMLTNLSNLEFLGFYKSSERVKIEGQEVGCLHKMETLFWHFNDQEDFNNFMRTKKQQLRQYILFVGSEYAFPDDTDCEECGHELSFYKCNMSREVLLPEGVQKLEICDVTMYNGRGLYLKNAIHLKDFRISYCEEMKYLFCLSSSPKIFQNLETLEIYKMKELGGLFSGEADDGIPLPMPIPIQLPVIGTFSHLKQFMIKKCNSMKKLFPYGLLSNLQNLQELRVGRCEEMEEIIASEEEEEEGSSSHSIFTHNLFTLPNLRKLDLRYLPELKSICNAKLKCDSLEYVGIIECPELKNIPILHPLSSLKQINVIPEEWWESVEWGHPNNKFNLEPILHFGSVDQRRQAI